MRLLTASGIVLLTLLLALIYHTFCFTVMRIRVTCSSLIYSKTLKLKQSSIAETTTGKILNFLGNDITRIDQLSFSFQYLRVGPLQAEIVTAVLWHQLCPYCLVGLTLIVLYIPLQLWVVGRQFSKLRMSTAEKTDPRLSLIQEIINGIRTIKLNGFESIFSNKVQQLRKEELGRIRRVGLLKAVNGTFFGLSSKIVVFGSILTFVLT
jgi:ATP-binding cassette subfamily C (CFTR/MRP) protein 4